MRFAKAEALGNDFVIVDAGQLAGQDASRVARQICRRSLDLGADGLILFRADGGLRTAALFHAGLQCGRE